MFNEVQILLPFETSVYQRMLLTYKRRNSEIRRVFQSGVG